ncbi:MAG TPA: hypothetical protein VNK95_16025, partial [Caldilineaceae bacterium]|nr:hypothetical protein [Caldilineaceae bacterium]
QMYQQIYRRTWRLLSEQARALLLAMLSVAPEGDALEWIHPVSNLSERALDEALAQLLDHFLLEVAGPVERPLYRLHRLTATFLQADLLLDWQGG